MASNGKLKIPGAPKEILNDSCNRPTNKTEAKTLTLSPLQSALVQSKTKNGSVN